MLLKELKKAVKEAGQKIFDTDTEPVISRPDEKFGDYATNAALQLAKNAAASPSQIAQQLAAELKSLPGIKDVSVAGPGFINFRLTDEALAEGAFSAINLEKPLSGQEILVEFGDPNPFKQMHIGHLYSYIVGAAISRLFEVSGATVRRLSYHGDVGLHVARAIYGQLELGEGATLGLAYALGAEKYASIPAAKERIDAINLAVYDGNDPEINELHRVGVKESFDYFDKILDLLSISTDKRYLESETIEPGLKTVKANIGKVFQESQGAVIYDGKKIGLHTRVFITSKGLPTYETKDLGLVQLKHQDFPQSSRSIVITATEQTEYFKVMLAALGEIDHALAKKTTHLAHGFVNLSSGKMSSRTGDVYSAEDLINEVHQAVQQQFPESGQDNDTALAALKYDFLKARLGGDITFDVKESVSLEGNSGPYLQYAHARAASILSKAAGTMSTDAQIEFDENERSLARKISEYQEVVEKAAAELIPHHIATYLYELAQTFNSFYEKSRIIGDEREALRLKLVKSYKDVLSNGLSLLNITAPEKM